MNVVGIDIGFGFTKGSNGKDTLIFKSIFGEATDIQFREHLLSSASPEEHLHIELEGESFFVGELADVYANDIHAGRPAFIESPLLARRYEAVKIHSEHTDFAKIMAMAALSRRVSANDTINLVTGLPVSFYRRRR